MTWKTNLEIVEECNIPPSDPHELYKFHLVGLEGSYGNIRPWVVESISWPPSRWTIDHTARTVTLLATNEPDRSKWVAETMEAARATGRFQLLEHWSDELFPVFGPDRTLLLAMERAATPLFGVLTYGVQLLAYVERGESREISVWIARRAMTKRTFPGMLDSTVGGSLQAGETPFECVVREAEEEVMFPPELTKKTAISTGMMSYVYNTDERSKGETGLPCPEIQYLYDMRVSEDVIPVPGDGEASEVVLMSIDELKKALGRGEFTPANAEVVLDFFLRHGVLTPENEPDYITIASRIRCCHALGASSVLTGR